MNLWNMEHKPKEMESPADKTAEQNNPTPKGITPAERKEAMNEEMNVQKNAMEPTAVPEQQPTELMKIGTQTTLVPNTKANEHGNKLVATSIVSINNDDIRFSVRIVENAEGKLSVRFPYYTTASNEIRDFLYCSNQVKHAIDEQVIASYNEKVKNNRDLPAIGKVPEGARTVEINVTRLMPGETLKGYARASYDGLINLDRLKIISSAHGKWVDLPSTQPYETTVNGKKEKVFPPAYELSSDLRVKVQKYTLHAYKAKVAEQEKANQKKEAEAPEKGGISSFCQTFGEQRGNSDQPQIGQ